MAQEYLGLCPTAPLSVKNVQFRNSVGPDVGYVTGKDPSYTLQVIRQAGMVCNRKIAAVEVREGRGEYRM